MNTTTQIPKQVSNALVRLVRGSVPKPITRGTIKDLTWGDLNLASLQSSDTSTVDDSIKIDLHSNLTPEISHIWAKAESGANNNQQFIGTTDTGLELRAEHGHIIDSKLISDAEGTRWSLSLHGHYWSLVHSGTLPSVWIGRIYGKIHVIPGNLIIDRSAQHLHIHGAYSYYLVRAVDNAANEESWFLVVDVGEPGFPNRAHLYADFLVLRFALGRHLRVDILSGIDDDGQTIAEIGGRLGKIHPENARTASPIPSHFSKDVWTVPFFERLSAAYRNKPELLLYVPLELYLDSLLDHLDGAYLKLHVALEAFSLKILEQAPEEKTEIVESWKDWSNWVNENRDKIASFAVDKYKNSLVEKVRNVVRLASGRVVPNALNYHGIEISHMMRTELEGRDVVAHTALMSSAGDRDYLRDLERIAVVRTMLISLVAKAIGYQGPIVGWVRNSTGHYETADPQWWNCTEDDLPAARAVYIATISNE